jgi:molybdopterin-dependent oxidoreductase alpha subunit
VADKEFRTRSGGGWQAVAYALRAAKRVGPLRLWRAMRSKNACKTCALGMGGQLGGMVNEAGRFPEVCKKSLQAMVADMQGRIERRFFETYGRVELQSLSPLELEAAGRLTEPMILEPGQEHYRPASWEEALDLVAAGLREAAPDRMFFYASGRSSNEAGFLLHLLGRTLGTNHVANCSFYCHQASGVGLKDSLGVSAATVGLEDLESCDLLFLIGGNPASNHPRFLTSLMKLRRRGGRVVVVNPLREPGLERFRVPSDPRSLLFGSEIASLYLQPRIGGDVALLAGIGKAVLEGGRAELLWIEERTEGFAETRSLLEGLDWSEIERESGESRERIEEAARLYGASQKTIFAWTMGITHHEHGVENVQWIVNLALLRGMAGKPGAGLLPIRGHSNVQGLGTVGLTPAIAQSAAERLAEAGIPVPQRPGFDPLAALEAAERGEMEVGLCLGGNLFGASPDARFAHRAFGRLKVAAYLSTSLNTGHACGLGETTVLLPVLARDEENQPTTQESMFSYVRLSDGGPRRHEGPLSEVEALCGLAERALGERLPAVWKGLRDHEAIRRLIARLVPELEPMAEIGKSGREFTIAGRRLEGAAFPTPTGRAAFRAHALPRLAEPGEGEVRLMTIRSEGQFNTVVYEEEDLYRGQSSRRVILLHPADLERLGLVAGAWVDVSSEAGEVQGVRAMPFAIAPGCAAMYYPEANALVPRRADPRSRTPAFKSALVRVRLSGEGGEGGPVVKGSGAKGELRAC